MRVRVPASVRCESRIKLLTAGTVLLCGILFCHMLPNSFLFVGGSSRSGGQLEVPLRNGSDIRLSN